MRALVAIACALAVALVASSALAHEASTAQIEIEALTPSDARVVVSGRPLEIIAPSGCRLDPPPAPVGRLRCPQGLAGQTISVGRKASKVDFVVVKMRGFGASPEAETSVVTADAREITLPGRPSASDVFSRYVRSGVEHVASGLDHLLFLIALFWQAWSTAQGSLRKTASTLLRTATAFTLAHSLTLGATTLGLLHVPAAVAEACIAWSLVLAALDVRSREDGAARGGALLAGLFGLVHGLGFAGAFAESRIPHGARVTALLAFNIGVELGQALLFTGCIAVVALVLRTLRQAETVTRVAANVSSYVVGVAGVAMLLSRVGSMLQP